MSEEEKKQEIQESSSREEQTQTNQTQSDESSPIERAERAAASMKEQNDRFENLVKRNERARAEMIVSGRSNAGEKEPVKEETNKDYASKILKGEL